MAVPQAGWCPSCPQLSGAQEARPTSTARLRVVGGFEAEPEAAFFAVEPIIEALAVDEVLNAAVAEAPSVDEVLTDAAVTAEAAVHEVLADAAGKMLILDGVLIAAVFAVEAAVHEVLTDAACSELWWPGPGRS